MLTKVKHTFPLMLRGVNHFHCFQCWCLSKNGCYLYFVLRWRNAKRTFQFVRSLISQSGKDKYTKLYIFRKPTISGIHNMKMKSSDLLNLLILIFVFILTYLFFHRSVLFYQKRSHLIQGIMW